MLITHIARTWARDVAVAEVGYLSRNHYPEKSFISKMFYPEITYPEIEHENQPKVDVKIVKRKKYKT